MRRLITTALELGWTLWAYEADIQPADDPAQLLTLEFTNWREREQAQNLCRVLAEAPAQPLLVWSGNSHAVKEAHGEWVPMGHHFTALSSIDPFVIDQTVTVAWPGQSRPWAQGLLAAVRQTLASYGGTAGILREQAPAPLDGWVGVDAVVVSTTTDSRQWHDQRISPGRMTWTRFSARTGTLASRTACAPGMRRLQALMFMFAARPGPI
jgi:hypothetical protein